MPEDQSGSVTTAHSLISNWFDMPDEEPRRMPDAFRTLLIERLCWIIDHQFSRLPQLLYRIDIDEQSAEAAFAQGSVSEVAPALADLIIERTLLRIKTREKG